MIRRILAAIWRILRGILGLPGDVLRSFTGGGGAAMPPPSDFEELADDEAGQLRQELEAPGRRREAGTAAKSLGGLVHAYAAGDRTVRDGFDMGRLPEHVAVALLTMHPGDLQKLAGATPGACGRWALGQRSGIVGIPECRKDWLPAAVSGKRRDEGRESPPALLPDGEAPFGRRLQLAA